ncbi:uncharacterized protein TNCV_289521 [Trichonephila clavipes]|nr:uncharacterized protein TNCV_289521 [Trichonephila clavipes]
MPLKNQSYKSRKHPSFNRASKAQRLRRIEEKRLTYNDSSFENNTIAPINEPDLFARCEVAVQTDPSEDIVHEDVTHQNNAM